MSDSKYPWNFIKMLKKLLHYIGLFLVLKVRENALPSNNFSLLQLDLSINNNTLKSKLAKNSTTLHEKAATGDSVSSAIVPSSLIATTKHR